MSKTIASYILSTYSFIFSNPLDNLLHVGYKETDNAIPIPSFEESLLINLCTDAQNIFESENNLLEIDGDVIVVGDIHGSFHDLLRVIKFSQEKRSKALFLGDYVDRGDFSLECITLLFSLKIMYPETFYLIRGNHEFDSLCSQYGFKDEIINYHNPKIPKSPPKRPQQKDHPNIPDETQKFSEFYANYKNEYCYKYSETLYNSFINAFSYLPIAAIINKETFCIHGGLSPKLDHIDTLNKLIPKPIINFEENQLLSDVVWSDPSYSLACQFDENPRGLGCLFNIETVLDFLKNNSLVRLIRGHQCVLNGSLLDFNEKCITVFSASSYDNIMQNSSAVIQLFQCDDSIKVTTFEPLERLSKSEAFYYKVQAIDEIGKRPCFSLQHPLLCNSLFAQSQVKFFGYQKSGCSKSTPMIKPKFTTNRRKTYAVVKKPAIKKLTAIEAADDGKLAKLDLFKNH